MPRRRWPLGAPSFAYFCSTKSGEKIYCGSRYTQGWAVSITSVTRQSQGDLLWRPGLKWTTMSNTQKISLTIVLSPLFIWLLFLLADWLDPLPDVRAPLAQTVLAQDGRPLWRFADADGVWRYPVTPDEVSPLYLQALLAYEDRWFYWHPGVNPYALIRAMWLNQHHGRIVSGGSTLSMQVARLIEPHSRTWGGKLRQIWRTLQLEWHYSKEEILQIYLERA